jgi:hypothetical protein
MPVIGECIVSDLEKKILSGESISESFAEYIIEWMPLPLCRGGNLKRHGHYGRLIYKHWPTEDRVERQVIVTEADKPPGLRQALKELEAVVECALCHYCVTGKDALKAFEDSDHTYKNGGIQITWWQPWAKIKFYTGWKGYGPIYKELNICPKCIKKLGADATGGK